MPYILYEETGERRTVKKTKYNTQTSYEVARKGTNLCKEYHSGTLTLKEKMEICDKLGMGTLSRPSK